MADNVFEGFMIAETPRAWLFQSHYWEKPEFVPKSQTTILETGMSMEVVLTLSDWICGKNSFEEFTYRDNRDEPE